MEELKYCSGIMIKTENGLKNILIDGKFDLETAGIVAYKASNYYRTNGTFHSIYIVAI